MPAQLQQGLAERIQEAIRCYPDWSRAELRRLPDLETEILDHVRNGTGNTFVASWCKRHLGHLCKVGFAVGQRVKHSEHCLRPMRDYWCSLGDYGRKSAARRRLDQAAAIRGTVTAVAGCNVSVKWDDGTLSHNLDYTITGG
jgi:hypothetical protein